MGIGVSIFLLAVGAILAFAVDYEISGLDLATVGYILMAVGIVGLVMTVVIWGPRSRSPGPRDTGGSGTGGTGGPGGTAGERQVRDDRP